MDAAQLRLHPLRLFRRGLGTRIAAAMLVALSPLFGRTLAARSDDRVHEAVSLSRQLIVVVADQWSSSRGTLWRFARSAPSDPWRALLPAVPVRLGAAGLAWGRGIQTNPANEPLLTEGDQHSPAGVFRVTGQFGYGISPLPAAEQLPFEPILPFTECVDDSSSPHYNRIVTRPATGADWRSAEPMSKFRSYHRGIVFDQNATPPLSGRGSCIFLHEDGGEDSATLGCTVATAEEIATTAAWLRRDAAPLLIQISSERYKEFRSAWRLPDLGGNS